MAEQIRVVSDGEEIILTVEGEAGRCWVRTSLDEAKRFRDILNRAIGRAIRAEEDREAWESSRISGADEGNGVCLSWLVLRRSTIPKESVLWQKDEV